MFSVNSGLRMINNKLQTQSQRLQSHHKMVRFAVVGVGGFVVDCWVCALLHYVIGLPLMTARIVSFIAAATTTWFGNRVLTFGYSGFKPLRLGRLYCLYWHLLDVRKLQKLILKIAACFHSLCVGWSLLWFFSPWRVIFFQLTCYRVFLLLVCWLLYS